MAINVTGPGQRGANGSSTPTNAQQTPVPDPTGERARVTNAWQQQQQQINPNSLGGVGGQQFTSPGAAGVTKYGLFAGPGQPAPMVPPGTRPPGPTPSPTLPFVRPMMPTMPNPMARLSPQAGTTPVPSPTQPRTGSSLAPPPGASVQRPPTLSMSPTLSVAQRIQQAPRLLPQQQPAPSRTMQAQSAPPAGGTMSGFSSSNGGDGTLHSTAAQDGGDSSDAYGSTHATEAGAAGDGGGGLLTAAAQSAGGIAGNALSDFINAYNQQTGGASGKSFSDFFNQMAPSFQENSLTGAVGQNMQQMMDPAAWQQMAQNRLDAATQTNTASLNEGQRRLQDQAGRSGLANTGGADASLLRNYANAQGQAGRDIFNDTLGHQMDAANMAGSYANSLRGQDVGRSNILTGLAGQGASQDLANNRLDNPSAIEALRDILGAGGQAAGGAASMLGPLLGLLAMG